MTNLRQGDVVKYHSVDGSYTYGVIITADCDLAQRKFGRQISFLPLVSVDEFIQEIWFPQLVAKEETRLCGAIEKIDNSLTVSDIDAMLLEGDASDIVARFRRIYSISPPQEVIERYAHLRSDRSIGARLNFYFGGADKVRKAIRAAILGGRAEFFFLPEQTKLPGMGSMVLLRYVSSFPAELLNPSYEQIVRLGRVEIVYRLPHNLKYAMAQSFAYLFSRIGIEDEIEMQQSLSAELASEKYALGDC